VKLHGGHMIDFACILYSDDPRPASLALALYKAMTERGGIVFGRTEIADLVMLTYCPGFGIPASLEYRLRGLARLRERHEDGDL